MDCAVDTGALERDRPRPSDLMTLVVSVVHQRDSLLSRNQLRKHSPHSLWAIACGSAEQPQARLARYLSEVLIEVNFVFRLLPRPLTAAIIVIEMPAAISPYSMAVAPDSSARNFAKIRFKCASCL